MTPPELLALLHEFHRETLELFEARVVKARSVSGYDANNGYQQVIGRQEVHLRWLSDAIADLGGTAPDAMGRPAARAAAAEPVEAMIEGDVRSQEAFLDRWSARVPSVTNARNRKMLELILGEMREHLRVLQQAKAGRSDLLGRHTDGKVLRGSVLPARPRN